MRPALLLYRGLVSAGLGLTAPWLWLRDRAVGKSRPPLSARLGRNLRHGPTDGLWVHAVSVGEVEVATRFATATAEALGISLTITATTATGLGLAEKRFEDARILASPIDLPGPVERTFVAVEPRLLAIVETELWPELLAAAGRHRVPTALVNARLSDKSFARYRRIRSLFEPLLEPLSLVLSRSEIDAQRFRAIGVPADRVHVVGDLKLDCSRDERPLEWEDSFARWSAGRFTLAAGSTLAGEEDLLLDAVCSLPAPPMLLLAPRHPERFDEVAELVERRHLGLVRRSDWRTAESARPDVVLLDTIGELARAYRLTDAAFVGGSLVPTGGHNPIEPAIWNRPVLTGPHTFNFRAIFEELAKENASITVGDAPALASALALLASDPDERARLGSAGAAVVSRGRGASQRSVDALVALARRSTP